jgi:hypothetical protein
MGRIFAGVSMRAAGEAFGGEPFAGVTLVGAAFVGAAFAGVTLAVAAFAVAVLAVAVLAVAVFAVAVFAVAVFAVAAFVGAVFAGPAFAGVTLAGAAFADEARRTPLPLAFGWASSAGAALTFALAIRGATWFGLLLPRAGRPALGVSRLGIEGFDFALVIWRGSARPQGAPGREVYSLHGCIVSRRGREPNFRDKTGIYSVSQGNFSASKA